MHQPSARVRIRLARRGEGAGIAALLARQLADHGIRLGGGALRRAVDGLLARPARGRALVASAQGAVVGVAVLSYLWTLEHGGRAAWLDELYVEPAHRGEGVGTALLHAAAAVAAAAGARALDLEVQAGHERATRLYRREGFVRHQRQRWFLPLARRRRSATGGPTRTARRRRVTQGEVAS